jgi:hypothetical protein
MGAPRPRADVSRRLAAAIAVVGAVLATLVVCVGAAVGAPQPGGTAGTRASAVPTPASLQPGSDLLVVGAPGVRGQDDLDLGWAEPGSAALLLSLPAGFLVAQDDPSVTATGTAGPERRQQRGPPGAPDLAPR